MNLYVVHSNAGNRCNSHLYATGAHQSLCGKPFEQKVAFPGQDVRWAMNADYHKPEGQQAGGVCPTSHAPVVNCADCQAILVRLRNRFGSVSINS